eukprot:Platyproteum_vivax@DN4016_c0_g1_i2.p1
MHPVPTESYMAQRIPPAVSTVFEYIDTENIENPSGGYAERIKRQRVQHDGPSVSTKMLKVDPEMKAQMNRDSHLDGVTEVEAKPKKHKRQVVWDPTQGEYVLKLLDELEDPPPDYVP